MDAKEINQFKFWGILIIIFVQSLSNLNAQTFTIGTTLGNGGQRDQIAFDALGFISGEFCSCSFIPPGKVADYFGFQYLRDNDITQNGHNSDFSDVIANNLLSVLDSAQKARLIQVATEQVDIIKQYAYMRFPLIDAFMRMRNNDMPSGSNDLDSTAIQNYSAALYHVDGQISLKRAQLYAEIINELTDKQKHYLDSLKSIGEKNMPVLPLQIDKRPLNNNQFVGVMSLADDIFSWYTGNLNADVYFCPERQGNYFGSFYLKDAPAMGVSNYSIDTSLSQTGGDRFLAVLNSTQYNMIANLVNTQKSNLYAIVDKRTEISTLLRNYLTQEAVDTAQVLSLSEEYGKLDGQISYLYASMFSQVNWILTQAQKDSMTVIRNLSEYPCSGAYLYSDAISMPAIENTDFLFNKVSTQTTNIQVSDNGYYCMPNPFINRICIKNTNGTENYQMTNASGENIWYGKYIESQDFSYIPKGLYVLRIENQNITDSIKLIKQ